MVDHVALDGPAIVVDGQVNGAAHGTLDAQGRAAASGEQIHDDAAIE
jgi:hypothetical protein